MLAKLVHIGADIAGVITILLIFGAALTAVVGLWIVKTYGTGK